MSKRTIIIVWGWSQGGMVPPGGYIPLYTPEGHCLVCADVRKDPAGQALLDTLISKHTTDGSVLLFLHKTAPHSYSEDDRLELLKAIEPSNARQVRVRLFGGGTEPLYFGWDSELGILGIRGRFPDTVKRSENHVRKSKKSNLLIEGEENKISQAHFDYVWKAYWLIPKQLTYKLAERFRFWADGFELQPQEGKMDFSAYLQHYDLLWKQLAYFAGIEVEKQPLSGLPMEEYNFDNYELFLGYADPELLKEVRQARKLVRNSITPGVVKEEISQKIEDTFNALFGLFKHIPANPI